MDGENPAGASSGLGRTARNPFYVLSLPPSALRTDIALRVEALRERLGVEPQRYATPLGERALTMSELTWAAAELRDPDRRLHHELRYVPVRPRAKHLRLVGGGS